MKNFKGLHTLKVGELDTAKFTLSNAAKGNWINTNTSRVPEAIPKVTKKEKK